MYVYNVKQTEVMMTYTDCVCILHLREDLVIRLMETWDIIHTLAHTCSYMLTRTYIQYIHTHIIHVLAHTYTRMCSNTHTCTSSHTHTHTHAHTHIQCTHTHYTCARTHVHTHVLKHTHAHTHTHTHTHTPTHTHTQSCSPLDYRPRWSPHAANSAHDM